MSDLRLLAVFAHPDDESFGIGGTLAKYASEGVRVTLICATRGEVGQISDPSLATPDRLGEVREGELRCACAALGVLDLRFLDCIDGQVGTCGAVETEGKIVRAIRELRPNVVVTFGPDGIYGHADHVAIGYLTTAAFHSAADPAKFADQLRDGLAPFAAQKLYYAAVSRSSFRRMRDEAAAAGVRFDLGDIDLEHFGVEDDVITTVIDVSDFLDQKWQAIQCHRTQIQPNGPFSKAPAELRRRFMGQESYTLAVSRVKVRKTPETDLFEGIA
ncbi:MAG: PIG-L family deacetylase [Chloroflexi bacterium]|nr:PIG-L family deacetylase [Chloroflexota bacterium]